MKLLNQKFFLALVPLLAYQCTLSKETSQEIRITVRPDAQGILETTKTIQRPSNRNKNGAVYNSDLIEETIDIANTIRAEKLKVVSRKEKKAARKLAKAANDLLQATNSKCPRTKMVQPPAIPEETITTVVAIKDPKRLNTRSEQKNRTDKPISAQSTSRKLIRSKTEKATNQGTEQLEKHVEPELLWQNVKMQIDHTDSTSQSSKLKPL